RCERQRSGARGQMKKLPAVGKFHRVLPERLCDALRLMELGAATRQPALRNCKYEVSRSRFASFDFDVRSLDDWSRFRRFSLEIPTQFRRRRRTAYYADCFEALFYRWMCKRQEHIIVDFFHDFGRRLHRQKNGVPRRHIELG